MPAYSQDPFRTERRVQHIFEVLGANASAQWRLLQIVPYIPPPPVPGYTSHLLELAHPIARCAEALPAAGVAPRPVAALARRMRAWSRGVTVLRTLDEWRAGTDALARCAARGYLYAGDVHAAAHILSGRDVLPVEGDANVQRGDMRELPKERATRMLEWYTLPPPAAQFLSRVVEEWMPDTFGPCVPVAERALRSTASAQQDSNGVQRAAGTLYSVQATCRRTGDAVGGPRLTLTAPVEERVVRAIKDSAQQYLRQASLLADAWHVSLRFAPSPRTSLHGASAVLGLAAATCAAVQCAAANRVRETLPRTVAYTGRVSATGQVKSVAEETLPAKVAAAFFSPLTTLAVPRAQEQQALAHRDALRRRHPHGHLDVVGVRSLSDTFAHRRLVVRTTEGRAQYALRVLWANRYTTVAALLVVLLSMGLAGMLYGPIDQNPAAVRLQGEQMVLVNAGGDVVDRITVGEHFVQRASPHSYALRDLAGDATNEVCWIQGGAPTVQCKNVSADTLLWRRAIRPGLVFPQKPFVDTSDRYVPRSLIITKATAQGPPRVWVQANHSPYFPCVIVQFDGTTGTVRSRYVHPGHLTTEPEAFDLDGDGIKELIAAGINNSYEEPILVVLDPRYPQGMAPHTAAYDVRDIASAAERAYVRLPQTAFHTLRVNTYSKPFRLTIKKRYLEVYINEGPNISGDPDNCPYIVVRLAHDLEPVWIGTSSHYDAQVRTMVANGQPEARLTTEEVRAHMQSMQYWTGRGWSTTPQWNPEWAKRVH
ncbi:hypothetical protein [Salisaeta longa]|uniref:hypothetical protein n=1 Tax=Salisaeta longa TaxID=503170 RepID=UPI0004284A22|nr:hypothetical protein [Salisaeta longa]